MQVVPEDSAKPIRKLKLWRNYGRGIRIDAVVVRRRTEVRTANHQDLLSDLIALLLDGSLPTTIFLEDPHCF